MSNVLIGFGSTARVGKDFAYSIIKEFIPTANRIAFADALKEDLAQLFKNNGLDFYALDANPEEKKKIRPLMVEYGQLMRKFNDHIWIDRALNKVTSYGLNIVTDVRFPNEVEKLKEKGGIYVHIHAEVPPVNDIEAELLPVMSGLADYRLYNDFTFNYNLEVKKLVETMLNQKGLKVSYFV